LPRAPVIGARGQFGGGVQEGLFGLEPGCCLLLVGQGGDVDTGLDLIERDRFPVWLQQQRGRVSGVQVVVQHSVQGAGSLFGAV
jgi:hypothetical protein